MSTESQVVHTWSNQKNNLQLLNSYLSESSSFTLKDFSSPASSFDLSYVQKNLKVNKNIQMMYSDVVSSTQTMLYNDLFNIPSNTIYVASVQTMGKGRGGNQWDSNSGCLMFTYKFSLHNMSPFFQYLICLIIIKAIKAQPGCENLQVRIKWPNDIYAELIDPITNNKSYLKMGGILCQTSYSSNVFDVFLGIGINVFNSKPTICLADLYKQKHGVDATIPFSRESLLCSFLYYFEKYIEIYETCGFEPLKQEYLQHWLHSGQKVLIKEKNKEVVIHGLTSEGYLLALDCNDDTINYELHPDGNSFDFLSGLIVHKEWKEPQHRIKQNKSNWEVA